MVHIEDLLVTSLTQVGKPYVMGAEARADDPNPVALDCSELVQYSCDRDGVTPVMPDGAFFQWRHCVNHGTQMKLDDGIRTRGALLFIGDPDATQFAQVEHVAFSLGGEINHETTVEARGRAWGVGCFPARNRFTMAALIPGVDYGPRTPRWPSESEENDMRQFVVGVPWLPANSDGTDPFFVVSETDDPHAFTVTSLHGAPHSPPWSDGAKTDIFEDSKFLGLKVRRYKIATGRNFTGAIVKDDRLAVPCEGGGTYQIARLGVRNRGMLNR
jgi:hypothetical protein